MGILAVSVSAMEGTALFHFNKSAYDAHKKDGVWLVDIATGKATQLFGNNDGSRTVDVSALSWDGKQVAFVSGGKC